MTFRALFAALEETGEETRALQLLWEADAAGGHFKGRGQNIAC